MQHEHPLLILLMLLSGALAACVAPPVESNPRLDPGDAEPETYRNVPLWTMGGKQFWADESWESGWRIQRNLLTGHHRLLDPFDVRRAWGNFAGCEAELARCRAEGEVDATGEHVVVLLHGMVRSKDSWAKLARAVEDAGFDACALNYPSTQWAIEGHAIQVERVLNRLPASVERVSFVTHSLGGLVAREVLRSRAPADDWRERVEVERLVMLFPPNQGAHKADEWHDTWWFRGVLGPAGQQLTSAAAQELPVPDVPTGIIAGGRGDGKGRSDIIPGDDDGTVAVRETRLEGAQHIVLDVGHTFGIDADETVAAVLTFLRQGEF